MSPVAAVNPLNRLVGLVLLAAFVLTVLVFRLSSRAIFIWLPVAIALWAAQLVFIVGQSWALDHRKLTLARWLTVDSLSRAWLNLQIALQEGQIETAKHLFAELPPTAFGNAFGWNLFINALINAGLYREAVTVRRRFGTELRAARNDHAAIYGLALLNIAEALYNLGRWRRAKQLMLTLEARGFLKDPLNRAGGTAQLAWIAAHDGDASAALTLLSSVNSGALPYDYRAELHFTFVVAHLANRDVPSARASLENARRALSRFSSKRNILFLEARCARAEGDLKEAARLCELAANHDYRGQGGDGLLLWGDVCSDLGDLAGARRAWQLAIDRDPESESARFAQQRLSTPLEKSA
ncbi:MAG: hypothetical protein QM723_21300 [Myxococcaceae bacterium]